MPIANLDDLRDRLREFARARDWEPFHTPKNLSVALLVEAAELAEIFQWLTPEQSAALTSGQREHAAQELADVLIYLTRLADVLDIPLLDAAETKIEMNARKYPAPAPQGSIPPAAAAE